MNCQGLGNFQKRKDVINFLRSYDIICLQDTHFHPNMHDRIKNEWGYKVFFSSYKSNSRGVAILLKNTFEHKIFSVITDNTGNLLMLDINIQGKRLTLATVYAPNNDCPEFFTDLKEKIV